MRVSVFGGREITQDIYDETVIMGDMLAKEGYTIFCGQPLDFTPVENILI